MSLEGETEQPVISWFRSEPEEAFSTDEGMVGCRFNPGKSQVLNILGL